MTITMPITPSNELRASLENHNKAFETLLQLIPAKYYLPQERDDDNVRVVLPPPHRFVLIASTIEWFQVPEKQEETIST